MPRAGDRNSAGPRLQAILGWSLAACLFLGPGGLGARDLPPCEGDLSEAAEGLAREEFVAAEGVLRRLLASEPSCDRAFMLLAEALVGQGRASAASRTLVARAEVLLARADARSARLLAERAVELDSRSGPSWALLGRIDFGDRRYQAAAASLQLAAEVEADRRTLYYLGSAQWENNQVEEAEQTLRRALELGPDSVPVLVQIGRLLRWQGRHDEALDHLERAVASGSVAPDVRVEYAQALAGAERLEEAVEAYRAAVALAPEHSEVRYGLARLLTRLGDVESAEREFAAYERLYLEDQTRIRAEGVENAAIARGLELLTQDPGAAVEHLLALEPSPDALAALARAYREMPDLAAAVAALERAVALAPERDDLRTRLLEARLAESLP